MINCIFLAPGRAALEAEAGYRAIWQEWLEGTAKRIGFDPQNPKVEQWKCLKDQLSLAPVMKINGSIEIGLTMRIASVKDKQGGVMLGTGPIGISGGYSKQTTEESVMSVRACFTLTNEEVSLDKFLEKSGIDLEEPSDFGKAVEHLKKGQEKK
jgi:hypothetical protein